MSKTSPLSREGLSPSLSLSLIDSNPQQPDAPDHTVVSPKTGKPYRVPSPAQKLSSELNWDLAQLKNAASTLSRLSAKYKLVIPKIMFKDVTGEAIIAGLEKEIRERVGVFRIARMNQIKEKIPLDTEGKAE